MPENPDGYWCYICGKPLRTNTNYCAECLEILDTYNPLETIEEE